jgi:hypothetical protein
LFDGENISFDASLVIYINSTNIPPIMIINRIYESQNLLSLQLVSFLVKLYLLPAFWPVEGTDPGYKMLCPVFLLLNAERCSPLFQRFVYQYITSLFSEMDCFLANRRLSENILRIINFPGTE